MSLSPDRVPGGAWRPPLRQDGEGTGYYGEPVLLSGPWHNLVTAYFFLGGISGASMLLAVLARRFGDERNEDVARVAALVSLATVLPAPVLLVLDLGRRSRFHHMLRVFKPLSPMNTGTWALTVHGLVAGLAAWHELAQVKVLPGVLGTVGRRLPAAALDAVAAPVALYFSAYTGTLLSATAIPVWARRPALGPLFMASAAATGTAAVDGALALAGGDPAGLEAARMAAVAAELALETAWQQGVGEVVARPLTRGRAARWLKVHKALGVGVPVALAVLPWRKSRAARLASSVAVLAGGYCLRQAVVQAGHESATDPEAVLSA